MSRPSPSPALAGAGAALVAALLLGLQAGAAPTSERPQGRRPAEGRAPQDLSSGTGSGAPAKDLSSGTSSSIAAEPPPRMPGPARGRGRPGAAAQNHACEACHPEVAAEWRSSLHRKASTEPSYVRSLAREPSAFCRGCHAPEGDPDDPGRAAIHLGVGCVTCHAPEGVVLASPRPGGANEAAPHALIRSAEFAGVAACASCHEFEFPGSRTLMQSTVREHQASSYAALPCAACHMPTVAGGERRRSHAFVASRDREVLARAIKVAGERPTASAVRLSLEPGAVGHAFPTGDLFRRLVVRAEVVGGRARAERILTRHFGADTRTLVVDDRVGAQEDEGGRVIVDLELGEAARGRAIRWQLRYERVAFPRDEGSRAELDGALVIAEGVLAAAP
ncbi:MAG: multiheme c-type cytochrome [Nannocystaceae bacterium]